MKVKQSVVAGCLFLIANMIGCGIIVSNSYGSVTSMDVKLTIRPPLSVKLWEFGTGGTIISSPAIGDDRDYVISASTNLVDWVVLTNVLSNNATLQIRDPAARNFKQRFYRGLLD